MNVEKLTLELTKASTEEDVAGTVREWLAAHDKQTEQQYEEENKEPSKIL
jgi:hypothetical protein